MSLSQSDEALKNDALTGHQVGCSAILVDNLIKLIKLEDLLVVQTLVFSVLNEFY